jgi:site-specific recombinase XerD
MTSTHLTPLSSSFELPILIRTAGDNAQRRFLEFFTVTIRNPNTRAAYARAVARFLEWAEERGVSELGRVSPIMVAAYVEELGREKSAPTVKQHLAAIGMLFDWMVSGGVLSVNPAAAVRGPKHVVKKGKTPVLTAEEARTLLDSIDTSHIVGLRDRALLSVMLFSFARIGAVLGMRVEDYYHQGRRSFLRLHEKGGKFHEVPAHHTAQEYLDAYLEAAGIRGDDRGPLFRTAPGRTRALTTTPMQRREALSMIKRRVSACGFSRRVCNHSFRATGITAYLENGGTIEKAQAIAGHESPRTTKLYDRTSDELSLDEIERIRI